MMWFYWIIAIISNIAIKCGMIIVVVKIHYHPPLVPCQGLHHWQYLLIEVYKENMRYSSHYIKLTSPCPSECNTIRTWWINNHNAVTCSTTEWKTFVGGQFSDRLPFMKIHYHYIGVWFTFSCKAQFSPRNSWLSQFKRLLLQNSP